MEENVPISRKLTLKILQYLIENPMFYFPFFIRCKGLDGSNEYIEVVPQEDDYEMISNFDDYNDFILVENLKKIYLDTIKLMSKGFIEKITNEKI